jgi:hypothetical protein
VNKTILDLGLGLIQGVSRLYRVEWEPPHWAAALRLGVVQQSSRCQRRLDHRRDRSRGELFALRQTGNFQTFSPNEQLQKIKEEPSEKGSSF